MHAEAFEDERFDTEIRSRHDAGLALTGDDVGTPIIAMDTPAAARASSVRSSRPSRIPKIPCGSGTVWSP